MSENKTDEQSRSDVDFEKQLFGRRLKSNVGLAFILFGISLITLPVVTFVQGMYSQRVLERQWQEVQMDKLVLMMPELSQDWFPATKLIIPKTRTEAMVVEGTGRVSLSQGPGHFPGTANPGQEGNCCIAGHRNMYGSWFRGLDKLHCGDTIILRTPDSKYVYKVTRKFEVAPDDLSVLKQTEKPTLTLITCTPITKPTHRLVIVAKLVEEPKISASSRGAHN